MASKSFDNLIEEIGSMSVIDLSQFVKALETKFGVSAAVSMSAAAAPAEAAAAQEEKAAFKVLLIDGGAEKLKSIKALRQVVTTLGLAEAKKAVEEAINTPFVVAESAAKADAQKMKEVLEAAGAKVQLQ